MSPEKEKALELVDKMYIIIKFYQPAIASALVAVDELIKETGKKWWYDVKQEMEKL